MNRRKFLANVGAVAALPLLPSVDLDPYVRGIVYQDWPLGTERPRYYWSGYLEMPEGYVRELSYFLEKIEQYNRASRKPLYWKIIPWKTEGLHGQVCISEMG